MRNEGRLIYAVHEAITWFLKWEEFPMSINKVELERQAHETIEGGPFDLDIRIIESSDAAALINLTDDGCGSTCPRACVTKVG
jgi:FxLD family lantipeptide